MHEPSLSGMIPHAGELPLQTNLEQVQFTNYRSQVPDIIPLFLNLSEKEAERLLHATHRLISLPRQTVFTAPSSQVVIHDHSAVTSYHSGMKKQVEGQL